MSVLPALYGITATSLFPSVDKFLERLVTALDGGLRLLQVREKSMGKQEREEFAARCVALCKGHACRVLVNGDVELARKVAADGVHVPGSECRNASFKMLNGLVGVSCHDAKGLEAGLAELEADFAVLSPVNRTLTHADAQPLGWEGFAALARKHDKPIYALGGLSVSDVKLAMAHGACGVASMRDVWGVPVQAVGMSGA